MKPMLPRTLLLLLLASIGLPAQADPAALARARASGVVDARTLSALEGSERVRVIVVLERDGGAAPAARASAVLRALPAGSFQPYRSYQRVPVLAGSVDAAGLAQLAEDPRVRRVGPDRTVRLAMIESLPLVRMDLTKSQGFTGGGRRVAMIDSGADASHLDLEHRIVDEQCYCLGANGPSGCCSGNVETLSGPGSAQDDNGHGTRVAGIIAGEGIDSIEGGAPGTQLVVIKAVDDLGYGEASDVVLGLDWVLANHPEVDAVNVSLGFGLYSGDCDSAEASTMALAVSIDALRAAGIVTVAASGNNGSGTGMIAPACIANATSVGAVWDDDVGSRTNFGCTDATTMADQVTCWSNSSSTTDLFAPGARISTPKLGGGTGTATGTSFAAPHATACVAALRDAQPRVSVETIDFALKHSPTSVVDPKNSNSYPRLDCRDAVGVVTPGVPALPGGFAATAALVLLLALAGLRNLSRPARAVEASPRSR